MTISDRELQYINIFLANGGNESKAMDAAGMNQYSVCMLIAKLGIEQDRRERCRIRMERYENDESILRSQERYTRLAESFRIKKSRQRSQKY